MRFFTRKLPIVICIFCCTNSYASTLEEAVDSAILNNKNIKYQDYKLKSVQTEKGRAISEFLPDISANIHYGNKNNQISGDNSDINRDFSNKERVEEVKIEQSLFNGFGSVAKYNEAKYEINSASAQNKDKRQEIAMLAAYSYCDLFLYDKTVELYKENRILAVKINQLAKNRKKAKVINNSDFIKFSYEALEIEQEYFDAISRLNQAREEFHNVVGIDYSKLSEPKINAKEFAREEIVQIALSNNQQLKSSYFDYLSAKSAHSVEKSKFAPTLSVVASANRQSNVVYLNQQDLTTRSIYLNLSVPIFQKGVEYANVSKASHERSAAKEEYEIMQDNVRKETLKSLDEYNLALEMEKSSQYLSDLALDRMKIYKKRAKRRLADKIELLHAQIEYNQRLAKNIEARMTLVKSYYKLKYYLGEL